jgi:hypothetical protein
MRNARSTFSGNPKGKMPLGDLSRTVKLILKYALC